ncbi:MAG: hypothetical protein QM758_12840 [Armatimonas sp.]
MKFRTSGIVLAATLLLGAVGITMSVSTMAVAGEVDHDPLVDTVSNGKGRINYNAGVVKATGYGAAPSNSFNPGQAKLMAMGAARADALRNLAMAVSSVQVTGTTKVKNYVLENDTIETKVSAMLQSPRVIAEKFQRDGTAEVTVELPLYGPGSIAEAVLPEVMREKQERGGRFERHEPRERPNRRPLPDRDNDVPDIITPGPPIPAERVRLKPNPGDNFREPKEPAIQIASVPRVKPIVRPNVEAGLTPMDDQGPFSAIIVDCRGLNLRAMLAPKLYDATGRELYGTVRVDPDFAIETGIVGYPRSMYDALRSKRAGSHPLIVKAIRFERGGTDPVVSYDDAERILGANKRDRFFEKTRVIFLCDPVR